jgi:hypothetical protein
MKWVTRERPKIDRIACPWLIARFIFDDHEMLRHGLVLYDALYAWCRDAQGEAHRWPPAMA